MLTANHVNNRQVKVDGKNHRLPVILNNSEETTYNWKQRPKTIGCVCVGGGVGVSYLQDDLTSLDPENISKVLHFFL